MGAAQNAEAMNGIGNALRDRANGFVKNVGQWNAKAKFLSRSQGMDFWVTDEGFTFQFLNTQKTKKGFAGHAVGMVFEGANKFSTEGVGKMGVRQFFSKQSTKSFSTRSFDKVHLNNIYKGVDAVAYFDGKTPRYDFIVKPGAQPSSIRFSFKGIDAVQVVSPNRLKMNTVLGERFQEGLFAYQDINGRKVSVPVAFKQIDKSRVGFEVGAYDQSKPLVIDPLVYGTYYGGDSGFDEVHGVAADSIGNVYLTGYTTSITYPVLFGPFGFNIAGGRDAFVSRLQGDAYNHDYSALIGGSDDDEGDYIQLDSFGNVWVLGKTASADFPNQGGPDGAGTRFLVRFAPNASTVLDPFAGGVPQIFKFGGAVGGQNVNDITSFNIRREANAVAGAPVRILVTGNCTANGVPELFPNVNNSGAFFASIDYSEQTRSFSTDLAACGFIEAGGIVQGVRVTGGAFDVNGNFFVSGTLVAAGNVDTATNPGTFFTTPSVFTNGRLLRNTDVFVRKHNRTGSLAWSAILGGSAIDFTEGFHFDHDFDTQEVSGSTIATDTQGNAYVLTRSNSFDYPRTRGVFGEAFVSGNAYIGVTKISSDGSQLLYSTHIRNGGSICASGIAVDPRGNAYLTGQVQMSDAITGTTPPDPIEPNSATARSQSIGSIPTFNPIRATYEVPALPETRSMDGWFMILNADATGLIRSTYVGGAYDEGLFAPSIDAGGDVWIYGWIDTERTYTVFSSTGTPTNYLPGRRQIGFSAGFITPLAFKAGPEPANQLGQVPDSETYFGDRQGSRLFGDYHGGGINHWRDGFVLRFREVAPLISTFTVNPSPLPGGDPNNTGNVPSASAVLTLSAAAPAGGARITLTLDNSVVASFDPSASQATQVLTIPAGQTTLTTRVFGRAVTVPTNVNVRADYLGNVQQATLQVIPWLNSVTLSTSTVIGGSTLAVQPAPPAAPVPDFSLIGTVRLEAAAPAGGVQVTLTTDRPEIVSYVGGNVVTVPEGRTSVDFQIATTGVSQNEVASVNGTLLGVTRTASLGITPARLSRVVISPDTIASGESTSAHVELNGLTPSNSPMRVRLAVQGNPAGYSFGGVDAFNTITIPAGARRSSSFTINTPFESQNQSRIVTATQVALNDPDTIIDGPVSGALNLLSITVDRITLDPTTVQSGGISTATVTLRSAAPAGGVFIDVRASDPSLATAVDANGIPITRVFVAEGLITATFRVQALFSEQATNSVDIIAYRGPTTVDTTLERSATLNILPLSYTLTISPSEVDSGGTATGTLVLSAPAQVDGYTIPVTSTDPTMIFGQPVFQQGRTTATFTIQAPVVDATRVATFAAQAGSLPASQAQLTVRAIEAVGISFTPSSRIRQGRNFNVVVTLNRRVNGFGFVRIEKPSLVRGGVSVYPVQFVNGVGTLPLVAARVPRTLSTNLTAWYSGTTSGGSTTPAAASVTGTVFIIR